MSQDLREHLQATIAHLGMKRNLLLIQLDETETLIRALAREEESLPKSGRINFPEESPKSGIYSQMSVRWAILFFLAEHAKGPQAIGDIAAALRADGVGTKGQSFNGNISAVLSQMTARGELSKSDQGFVLLEHGRAVWMSIKHSEKFVNRFAPLANEGGEQ